MTVTSAVRLLVVTDDSLFGDYTTAAVGRSPKLSIDCVSTLSTARSMLARRSVDCVVLDTELSARGVRELHRTLRYERPQLPVVLAAERPRAELPASVSCHAFVRKGGPNMGISLVAVVRILVAASSSDGHDTPPTTAA